MTAPRPKPIIFLLLITALSVTTTYYASAAQFLVISNCPYTVWAAWIPLGGGLQLNSRPNCPHTVSASSTALPSGGGGGLRLNSGQSWTIDFPSGTSPGRIWARTGCSFDDSGLGACQTGDCNGRLSCTGYGKAPNTLAEFALNQSGGVDFFDISLVDGFNVPMEFVPTSGGCKTSGPRCTGDVNGQCPTELKAPGGCNNPCGVFRTSEYCCTSGSCGPTDYSRYFKVRCPNAYSYPKDDATSTFTCPGGTNYRVVFCP